jgi:hypothetical protein
MLILSHIATVEVRYIAPAYMNSNCSSHQAYFGIIAVSLLLIILALD